MYTEREGGETVRQTRGKGGGKREGERDREGKGEGEEEKGRERGRERGIERVHGRRQRGERETEGKGQGVEKGRGRGRGREVEGAGKESRRISYCEIQPKIPAWVNILQVKSNFRLRSTPAKGHKELGRKPNTDGQCLSKGMTK